MKLCRSWWLPLLIVPLTEGSIVKDFLESRLLAHLLQNSQSNAMGSMMPSAGMPSVLKVGNPQLVSMNAMRGPQIIDSIALHRHRDDMYFHPVSGHATIPKPTVMSMMGRPEGLSSPVATLPKYSGEISSFETWKKKTDGGLLPGRQASISQPLMSIEELVSKMKQMNGPMEELSESDMRKLIVDRLEQKAAEKKAQEQSKEDNSHYVQVEKVNLVKTEDVFEDDGEKATSEENSDDSTTEITFPTILPAMVDKPLVDHGVSAWKIEKFKEPSSVVRLTTRKPQKLDTTQNFFEMPLPMSETSQKIPFYPRPVPPMKMQLVGGTKKESGLMSKMPGMLRTAMNSMRGTPLQATKMPWNVNSMQLNSRPAFAMREQIMENFPVMMPADFEKAMNGEKFAESPKLDTRPAFLGYIDQKEHPKPTNAAELFRREMEKLLEEFKDTETNSTAKATNLEIGTNISDFSLRPTESQNQSKDGKKERKQREDADRR